MLELKMKLKLHLHHGNHVRNYEIRYNSSKINILVKELEIMSIQRTLKQKISGHLLTK